MYVYVCARKQRGLCGVATDNLNHQGLGIERNSLEDAKN
jgi:hypothetical protein